ncbi:MAG: hypothetical protein CMO74_14220 [Verrucomicrobiales bacterium]|nr:hypothetical protein [Verrucomicrobiales bacterium]
MVLNPEATNLVLINKPIDKTVGDWTSGSPITKGTVCKMAGTLAGESHTYYFEAKADDATNDKAPLVSLESLKSGVIGDWTFKKGAKQLQRVQSANYSFTINRQDVNQFGQLSRIDSVAIDPPTVSLDFSYYLSTGANEALLGFNVETLQKLEDKDATNFIKTDSASENEGGRNFFILTTPQGTDAIGNSVFDSIDGDDDPGGASKVSTIALGNGYVTNYGVEASVGGMPTASVTVEGLNLRSDSGFHNVPLPAVNNERGTPVNGTGNGGLTFTLPTPVSGVLNDAAADGTDGDEDDHSGQTDGWSCLRPGDIEMHLGAAGAAGVMNTLPGEDPPTDNTAGSCHVQSFSIDVPMGRTPIQRLGTPYAYSRPLDFPLTVSVSVSAIVSDLKAGNVADQLFDFENHDLHFILREPTPDGTGPVAMAFYVRGAQLEGEAFSSSIGDNKSVDITFSCQVGGPEDTARGLMVAGSRGAVAADFLTDFAPFIDAGAWK